LKNLQLFSFEDINNYLFMMEETWIYSVMRIRNMNRTYKEFLPLASTRVIDAIYAQLTLCHIQRDDVTLMLEWFGLHTTIIVPISHLKRHPCSWDISSLGPIHSTICQSVCSANMGMSRPFLYPSPFEGGAIVVIDG